MAQLETKLSLSTTGYVKELDEMVKKTAKAVDDLSGESVELDINADGLKDTEKQIDSVLSSLEDKNIVIGADTSEIDKAAKKIDDLDGSTVNIDVETSGLDGLSDAFSGGALGGLLGGGLVGLAQAGIGAVVDGFGTAISLGLEFNAALGDMQAQTGATTDEMIALEQAAKDAFLGGVGESLAEATNIIANAQVRFGDIFDADELGEFTKQAQALGNTFDLDVNEVLAKSETLVKQYGLSGEEAFNTVAFALQNATSGQDDALDSLNEYAQVAVETGLTIQEFAALNAAASGSFNTDKINDALKEASIRIKAGDFNTAFDGISESADVAGKEVTRLVREIVEKGQSGELSIADALKLSTKEIEKAFDAGTISDTLRSQLQVGIAGTPTEDAGADLFARVFGVDIDQAAIDAKIKAAGKSISGAIGQYTSFEAVGRQFELFVTTVSQKLIAFADNVVAPVIGGVVEVLGGIKDAFDDVFGDFSLGDGLTDGLSGLISLFNIIVSLVRDRLSATFRTVFGIIKGVITSVYRAFQPIITIISDVINSFSGAEESVGGFGDIMKDLGDILGLVGEFIFDLLITPMELAIDIIVDIVRGVGNFIAELVGVKDAGALFSSIIDKIGAGLTNVKGTISGVIASFRAFKDAVKDLDFGKVVSDLLSGKNPFEGIGDKLSDAYNKGFNKATGKFEDNLDSQVDASGKAFEEINAQIQELVKNRENLSNKEIASERGKLKSLIDSNLESNDIIKREAIKLENALNQIKIRGASGTNEDLKKETNKYIEFLDNEFKTKLKESFVIDVPPIELKTDFVSDIDIQDFISKVLEGVPPLEAIGEAITGLTIENKQLEAIDEYIKRVDELKDSFESILDATVETPQYIQAVVEGQESFINELSKYAADANSVIDNLNTKKIDLQLDFNEAETDEQRVEILKQIDTLNAAIIKETIATSKTTNDDRKRLETQYNQFLVTNNDEAISLVRERANKEIEILNEKKKKAELTETQLQSKIAEITEQGQRRLREIQLSELSKDERNKELELQALDDKFKEEAEKYRTQVDVLLAITNQYRLNRLQVEKKFNKEEETLFDNLIDSLSDSFNNLDVSGLVEQHDEAIKSSKEVTETFEEQAESLEEQLSNQEISQKDFNEEIIRLEEEKNERLKELEKDKFEFIDGLNLALSESFKNLSDKYTESIEKQIASADKLIEARQRLDHQFELGKITQEQYTESSNELAKKNDEIVSASYENAALSATAATAAMILNGKKASKAVILTALNTLKALVPIFVAQIFGTEVGKLGVFGIITAAALIATLTALTAAGANEGIVGIDKNFKGKRDSTDTIPVWAAKGEAFINKATTDKNFDFLTWMNKTGKHWSEYPELGTMTVGENGLNLLTPQEIKLDSGAKQHSNINVALLANKIDTTNKEIRGMKKAFMDKPFQISQTVNRNNKNDVTVRVKIEDESHRW